MFVCVCLANNRSTDVAQCILVHRGTAQVCRQNWQVVPLPVKGMGQKKNTYMKNQNKNKNKKVKRCDRKNIPFDE